METSHQGLLNSKCEKGETDCAEAFAAKSNGAKFPAVDTTVKGGKDANTRKMEVTFLLNGDLETLKERIGKVGTKPEGEGPALVAGKAVSNWVSEKLHGKPAPPPVSEAELATINRCFIEEFQKAVENDRVAEPVLSQFVVDDGKLQLCANGLLDAGATGGTTVQEALTTGETKKSGTAKLGEEITKDITDRLPGLGKGAGKAKPSSGGATFSDSETTSAK